jgi:hypothetical protein
MYFGEGLQIKCDAFLHRIIKVFFNKIREIGFQAFLPYTFIQFDINPAGVPNPSLWQASSINGSYRSHGCHHIPLKIAVRWDVFDHPANF